jgi:hypothetical protein
MSTVGGDDRPQRPHQADRQACGHDHPQMDRANATRRSVCHVVLGVDGKTSATQAVRLQVLTCVIAHIGRQRSDQQLGGSRSLVGSTSGERLVDSHLVAAHSGDVLRASAVLHHDRGRRPVLADCTGRRTGVTGPVIVNAPSLVLRNSSPHPVVAVGQGLLRRR